MGLYYAPAAAFTKASESPYQSRNGLIFLRSQDPGMYEAINFARQNIDSGEGMESNAEIDDEVMSSEEENDDSDDDDS